jgi:hypothetical protein
MKKYIIISMCLLHFLICNGQDSTLLTFFNEVKVDSIINALNIVKSKYNYNNDIPDKFIIKYFLGGNSDELYTTDEAYNMDDNTYRTIKYKRTVNAILSKKTKTSILICYWLDEYLYLSTYDIIKDTVRGSYIFCIPRTNSDEFTYSILFPNDYIFTIETTDKTNIKLIKIDYANGKFIEQKSIIMDDFMIIEDLSLNNEKYNKALKLAGISETGELLEEKQPIYHYRSKKEFINN